MPSETQRAGALALTIAGFDPSSGAGITADLAVFAAHGIFGTSAITALTVQSTTGVRRVQPVSADLLAETLACLEADLPPSGIKIGMLGGQEQVIAVSAYLRGLQRRIPIVLDPVMHATSGSALLSQEGLQQMHTALLPLVDVVTPNAPELSLLTTMPCTTDEEVRSAAESLAERYRGLVVLYTGGDRPTPDDWLLHNGSWTVLHGEHIPTSATHGTGCAFSSAILCGLMAGQEIVEAAANAKAYVAKAMLRATPRGSGKGPMHLLWPLSPPRSDEPTST